MIHLRGEGCGRWHRRDIAVAVLALSTAVVGNPAAGVDEPAAPAIELGEHTVTVRVAPPGRGAVLFGFGHEVTNHITTLVRWERVLSDRGPSGAIQLELERPLPAASVWSAVDTASGQIGLAVPPGMTLREIPGLSRALLPGIKTLDLELRMAEVLLVRRGDGSGAWGLRAGDGGAADLDGKENGVIRVVFSDMWPVEGSGKAPTQLRGGDALIVLDPQSLRFSILRVAGVGGEQP